MILEIELYKGEENFFRKFSSPLNPHLSKIFKKGGLFFCHYFVRSTVERTMFAQTRVGKVLVKLFLKKLAGT